MTMCSLLLLWTVVVIPDWGSALRFPDLDFIFHLDLDFGDLDVDLMFDSDFDFAARQTASAEHRSSGLRSLISRSRSDQPSAFACVCRPHTTLRAVNRAVPLGLRLVFYSHFHPRG